MCFLESLLWLTLNIYHEARSEPETAQLAVAHVTLNRALQKHASVEQVVTAPYQFSWTLQQTSYIPSEPDAFFSALGLAFHAMITPDFTHGATFFHRDDVQPAWSREMIYVGRFGRHKFYRLPPKPVPVDKEKQAP